MGMKRKILSLLLCFVMVLSLLPTMAFAAEADTYDVWANGEQFSRDKLTINGSSGTATYDPAAGTVTLNDYIGGVIKAEKGDLILNVTGTNKITTADSEKDFGIRVIEGDLIISGDGDLEVDLSSDPFHSAIVTENGSLTVNMAGNLTVKSQHTAFYGTNGLNISGSGDVTVIKKGTELGVGILAYENDVTISGSGKVRVDSATSAVGLGDPNGELKIEGTSALISLTAGDGSKAVDNFKERTSPVSGSTLSNYAVIGAPDTQSAIYKLAYPADVWVDGKQFTKDNLTIECGSGTATYDPVTATVTLNGAQITQTHADSGISGAIYAGRDITLNVVGDSSISLGEYANGDGIYTAGNLTVMGNKALNITIKNENGYSDAVWVNGGKLTVDMEGDLSVDSTGTALSSTGDILISGSGSKTIRAGANGIYSSGADITLSGSGNVTIDAGYGIYAQTGKAELSGSGNVTIISAKNGAYSSGDMILSGTGKVDITGNENAVLLYGSAGELKLNGKNTAITLTAGDGNMAVYNDATGKAPVAGDNFDAYKCVIGSPDASAVTYKMEHGIVSEADCTTPQICMICHKVSGPALGHLTTAPDCTVPVFCLRCHEQIGPALGHDFTGEYKDNGEGTHSRICTRCNEYGAAENHSYEDYVCVCGAEDLAGAKEAAEEAILAEQGDDTSEAVVKAVEDALAAIDAATTVAEVNAAMEDGIAAIRAAKAGNVPPAPVTYTIIDGANSVWTKGSNSGLAVRSDATFVKFVGVKVDGEIVAAINYTAKEGSTMVNLTPAYLETLEVGIHSLEIVSNDGSASTNFTVKANSQPADSDNPQTGDSGMIYLWALILVVSAAGLSATAIYSRKRKIK